MANTSSDLRFNAWQLQELEVSTHRLRRLNRAAVRTLLRIAGGRVNRADGDSLEILAYHMALTTHRCMDIISNACVKRVSAVVIGVVCPDCAEKEALSPNAAAEWTEMPEIDPAQYTEIIVLQEFASRVFEQVSARCIARGIFQRGFHANLDRLNRALRRQRSYIELRASSAASRVQVRCDYHTCAVCHGEMKLLLPPIPTDPNKPAEYMQIGVTQ